MGGSETPVGEPPGNVTAAIAGSAQLSADAVVVVDEGSGRKQQPDATAGTATQRRSRRAGLYRRPGRRDMKEYPITLNELMSLGGLSLLATFAFSVAGFCGTTWWQLSQEFAFSPPHDAATAGYWHGIMQGSGIAAIALAIIGLAIVALGGATVFNIWNETEHES
ncbi:MAG TPA: hypothetical protein VN805_14250 [Caulobacteraceae bacterium]|nr:hypothetical protein [Caulobacteraceae bacterium]